MDQSEQEISDYLNDLHNIEASIRAKILSLKSVLSTSFIASKQLSLSNDDLAFICDHIGEFTSQEMMCLPNVQSVGFSHYFVKESVEIMMVLRTVITTFNLPPHDVIKPFLKNRETCALCTRERKHGYHYCSYHKKASSNE